MTNRPLPANWRHRSTTMLVRILADHSYKTSRLREPDLSELRDEIARRYS